MAKKFLYFIAFCIVAILAAGILWQVFAKEITAWALVPSTEFVEQKPFETSAYDNPGLWYSRPGMGQNDPARWQPDFATPETENGTESGDDAAGESPPALPATSEQFAVFFVHPTSFIDRSSWNAPLGDDADAEAERIAGLYVQSMASPFADASEIWAPKYRQATIGAFLTDAPEGQKAIDAAYVDVRDAYRFFIDSIDDDMPIVFAGHSQGSLHLLRLLREEVNGSASAERVIAAYAIGWPISVDHDLPEMGIKPCAGPDQTGCLLSWSSFAEPADPSDVMETYSGSPGLDGEMRGNSMIVCTNPLSGSLGGSAPESANLGTLVPDENISDGSLVPAAVPARCDDRGILLIGNPPDLGSSAGAYVLPGNNYHVYDIPLFWANTKADVVRRVEAWSGNTGPNAESAP